MARPVPRAMGVIDWRGYVERRDDAVRASLHQRGGIRMVYILLWLLGVPVTLLIILFLLGIGR
jgi:hypothetical protein